MRPNQRRSRAGLRRQTQPQTLRHQRFVIAQIALALERRNIPNRNLIVEQIMVQTIVQPPHIISTFSMTDRADFDALFIQPAELRDDVVDIRDGETCAQRPALRTPHQAHPP